MHEHTSHSGLSPQNVSGESSDNFAGNQGLLKDLSERLDLDVELLDEERVAVAVEHNPDQTLLLLESEDASAAVTIDVSGVTLAEAIEAAPQIAETIEFLAKGPRLAADGGSAGGGGADA